MNKSFKESKERNERFKDRIKVNPKTAKEDPSAYPSGLEDELLRRELEDLEK